MAKELSEQTEPELTAGAEISSIWTQRSLGIELPKNLKSSLRNDIEWLCNRIYPFIQLVNTDAVFTEETTVNFIDIENNWLVHDYGQAISASAPRDLNPKEGIESQSSLVMSGSKIGAQISASRRIGKLVADKGWVTAELIAGTRLMQRYVWIESRRYGFEIGGYTPDERDERCFDRLVDYFEKKGFAWDKRSTIDKPTKVSAAS